MNPNHQTTTEPRTRRKPTTTRLVSLALAATIGAAAIAAPLGAVAEELPATPTVPTETTETTETTEAPAAEHAEPAGADETAGETEIAETTEATAAAGGEEFAEAAEASGPADAAAKSGDPLPEASALLPEPQPFGPVNTAPVAVDDHWQMVQDTTLRIAEPSVLQNDFDPDGDGINLVDSTYPAVGDREGWGLFPGFAYTPPAGFTGTVTWQYLIRDEHGDADLESEWATVEIEVLPTGSEVALPPVAADDTYLFTPGAPLYIADFQGLLANDALDGQAVTSLEFPYGDQIGNGQVTLLGTGGAFLADAGDAAPDLHYLQYRVCTTVACSDATLWLYPAESGIEPSGPDAIPEAPVAAADVYGVVHDTARTVPAAEGLLANDSDIELGEPGELLEAIVDTTGLAGALQWSTDGSFTYTPPAGFTGTDTFHYYVNDQHAYTSRTVTVELQVGDGAVNHRPVAVDDHYTAVSGAPLYLPAPAQIANDTDADGDALEWAGSGGQAMGTWTTFSDGWSLYTPPVGFVGTDRLTYTVRDEHGLVSANQAEITIEVVQGDGEPNTPPVPVPDRYFVPAGQTITVPAGEGLLANDHDADGDQLAVLVAYDALSHGEAEVAPDGSFTFTAEPGFDGSAWLEFSITDGRSKVNSMSAEVVIFTEGEEPVLGADDAYIATRDTALEVAAPGLLANDHAPAGVEKTVSALLTEPAHGSVEWNADGSFVYVPDAGFTGSDSFRYVFTAAGEWNYPTVTIQVLSETPGGEGTPTDPTDPTDPAEGEGGTPAQPEGEPTPATPARPEEAAPAAVASAGEPGARSLADTGAEVRGGAEASALALLLGLVALVAARLRRRGAAG